MSEEIRNMPNILPGILSGINPLELKELFWMSCRIKDTGLVFSTGIYSSVMKLIL
jgi:hypothetical protein